MGKMKLTKERLEQLLKEGKNATEISKISGITVQAAAKRIRHRELKKNITKEVAKNAEGLVLKNLNLLGEITSLVVDLKETLQNINDEISEKKNGKEKDQKRLLKLNHIGELRQVLKTVVDIGKIVSDINEVRKFQDIVITVIREVKPDVANCILKKLSEHEALVGAFE